MASTVLNQAFLTLSAWCLTLQPSHTLNVGWVCVISLICRWQTEKKKIPSWLTSRAGSCSQMLIPLCLKSRISGNTDSPSTSAEGAGRNESQLCGFPKYLLITDNYCAAEISGSATLPGSAGGTSGGERYSQTWFLLIFPVCLLPWSCSYVQLHMWHQSPSPGRWSSAVVLQQASSLSPCSLPQPGPNSR